MNFCKKKVNIYMMDSYNVLTIGHYYGLKNIYQHIILKNSIIKKFKSVTVSQNK